MAVPVITVPDAFELAGAGDAAVVDGAGAKPEHDAASNPSAAATAIDECFTMKWPPRTSPDPGRLGVIKVESDR